MNRYYWIAIILTIIFAILVGIIWNLDLTNQELQRKIEFTLQIFTAIDVIAAIIFGILGLINQSKSNETKVDVSISSSRVVSELLNKEESALQYLSNLEATLDSVSRFVPLTTEYEQDSEENVIQILQSFEWAKRDIQSQVININRQPIDFFSAHQRFQRYILLGDPGSGKTTCLQSLTLNMISEYRAGRSNVMPLYVRLSEWKDRRTSAFEFLRISFEKLSGSASYLAREFEALLSRGDLLLILDGLNEMPNRQYYHEEKNLKISAPLNLLNDVSSGDAFRSKQDPRERSLRELALADAVRARFIVSCRKHEFFGSPKWQEVHILPMSDEQIMSFVVTYMSVKGYELQSILKTNLTLLELGRNPFFLRSMIRIYSPEISVIKSRGQFLEYLCNQLLTREKNRGIIFNQKELMGFISKFAITMIDNGLVGVPFKIDKSLKKKQNHINILIGTGLLVARGDGQLSFYHQIIQEFFAAYALREKLVIYRLGKLLTHKKWSEVVFLWHDISSNSTIFTGLIQALKMRNRPWLKPYTIPFWLPIFDVIILFSYISILTHIVIDILFRGAYILPLITKGPLLFFLFLVLPMFARYVWIYSSYHQEAISNASFILGRINNPIAINHLINAFKYVEIIPKRKNVAAAIANFGTAAMDSLIFNLRSVNRSIKLGCIESLGLIGNADAVDPLIETLNNGEVKLIVATAKALGNIGDPRAAKAIADIFSVIEKMAFPLFTYSQVVPTLNQLKQLDNILLEGMVENFRGAIGKNQPYSLRYSAVVAIGDFGHVEGANLLIGIATDQQESSFLRYAAVNSLRNIRHENIVKEIIKIYEEYDDLRQTAVSALTDIRYAGAFPELYTLLDHSDPKIRKAAIHSIYKLDIPESLTSLIEKLSDESPEVRREIAEGLGLLGTEEAAIALIKLIYDSKGSVRRKALESLDHSFPEIAQKEFIGLLENKDYPEKVKVIELLGNYRYPHIRVLLLQMCAETNDEIRHQAVSSLQKIDARLNQELVYVRTNSKLNVKRRLISYFLDKYLPDYSNLRWQAKLSSANEIMMGNYIYSQIQNDSELKRKYRPFIIFITVLLFSLFIVLPAILTAALPRGSIYLGKILLEFKWLSLVGIVLAMLSMLPKIRDGIKIKIIKHVYRFIRFTGFAVLIIALLGLGFYYWWICVPILVMISIGVYFFFRHILRKRNQTP